jgi:hypothetical protein
MDEDYPSDQTFSSLQLTDQQAFVIISGDYQSLSCFLAALYPWKELFCDLQEMIQ